MQQRAMPIKGQSHWCEGYTANKRACRQVVLNTSDHCEAQHPNRVRSITPSDKDLGPTAPLSSALSVDDLADPPPRKKSNPGTGSTEPVGITKRTGMISLDLAPGVLPAYPNGPAQHHLTLCFLGTDVDEETFAQACRRAALVATRWPRPELTGIIDRFGDFEPSETTAGRIPVVAEVNAPDVLAMHKTLADLDQSGFSAYRPHITLSYVNEASDERPEPPQAVRVSFNAISVHRGEEVRRYALGTGMAIAGQSAGQSSPSAGGWSPQAARYMVRQGQPAIAHLVEKHGQNRDYILGFGPVGRDEYHESLHDAKKRTGGMGIRVRKPRRRRGGYTIAGTTWGTLVRVSFMHRMRLGRSRS